MTRRPPHVEALEDRLTPATFGFPWPDAHHLTVSFAPDGTAVGAGQSQLFSTMAAAGGTYDLYSVVLHEAGHVFGVPDNADPKSAMFEYYGGTRAGLAAGDVAALQALYGARTGGADEARPGDDAWWAARDFGAAA